MGGKIITRGQVTIFKLQESGMPDWVREWDSNKTVIDGSHIITPKLFAGVKHPDNTITGTAIGRFELNSQNQDGDIQQEIIEGIYGFHRGDRTFCIDNTGNIQVGRGDESIIYDAETGKIRFGAGVQMQWIGATYIDGDGIFTGSLSAESIKGIRINAGQITAGIIDTALIDADALKATLITASNIEALTLHVTRGQVGGWDIDGDSIYRGPKANSSGEYTLAPGAITIGDKGIRGKQWRLEANGGGALAGENISWNEAGQVTFSESVQLSWTRPIDEVISALGGNDYAKLTLITSTGIYTGSLTASQITAGTISADRIEAGSIHAGKLNADSIKTEIINTDYINGLSCSFDKGTIGGWEIGQDSLVSGNLGNLGDTPIQIRTKASGSGYWVGGDYKPFGLTMTWCQSCNAGHFIFGQIAENGFTVKDGFAGIQMMSYDGFEYFCLSTNYSKVGGKDVYNRIAGWAFDSNQIWKNSVSLGADGSIKNGDKWTLHNDGSGVLASGNITWDHTGNVTFGASVVLNWENSANEAKELASAMAFGKMLYRDPTFSNGINSISIYNNLANGQLIITRETDPTAPNDSKQVLTIKTAGPTSPGNGGFCFQTMCSYRKIFIARIIARIPAGYHIEWSTNNIGTGGYHKWLTPTRGTGDWEEYISKVVCGKENFSTTNFFYITGIQGTTEQPLIWHVAYATVFDLTSTETYTTTIDNNGIYTSILNANQLTTGELSADRIGAGSIDASKINAASIQSDIINTNYINGLACTFERGTIGGWKIGNDSLVTGDLGAFDSTPIQIRSQASGSGYWYSGAYKPFGITMTWFQQLNAGHIVFGQIAASGDSVKRDFIGIQMMSWDNKEYFCLSANYLRSGSPEVYNRIAGWAFDAQQIWKNNVSLGSDGSIRNGDKWKLDNDGSGRIANGNITWDASGNVSFSDNVSLQWKNDIATAQTTNNGYPYKKDLIIYGDVNQYYPVVIKGGDQTLRRKIRISRAFNEQAPNEWANSSTHMGGLNLVIVANFGSWGGINYSYNISELEECYCRIYAGAVICGNFCMFAIFLRGGGSSGALYHFSSDQRLDTCSYSESPIPSEAPQICYNSDMIFNYLGSTAYAPAPRTITPVVENEIQQHKYAASTYIDASGIYTGCISAGQVKVDSELTVGGSSFNGSIVVKDAGNNLMATLNRTGVTAIGGSIGGWILSHDNIHTENQRVVIHSNGSILNKDGSDLNFWALYPDGSAHFSQGKTQFNMDGSGFVANKNIKWDTNGNVEMTGNITATSGKISGFTISGNVLKNTSANSSIEFSTLLGNASLYINSTNALIYMRADSARQGIHIETYATGAQGIYVLANAGSAYAIETYGPVQMGQRGTERWCVPGVLFIGCKYVTGYNNYCQKIWGDGCIVSSFTHIGDGKYKVVHNLYHTEYTVQAILWQTTQYFGFLRLLEKATTYFVIQNIGVSGRPDQATFDFIIYGRNRW